MNDNTLNEGAELVPTAEELRQKRLKRTLDLWDKQMDRIEKILNDEEGKLTASMLKNISEILSAQLKMDAPSLSEASQEVAEEHESQKTGNDLPDGIPAHLRAYAEAIQMGLPRPFSRLSTEDADEARKTLAAHGIVSDAERRSSPELYEFLEATSVTSPQHLPLNDSVSEELQETLEATKGDGDSVDLWSVNGRLKSD